MTSLLRRAGVQIELVRRVVTETAERHFRDYDVSFTWLLSSEPTCGTDRRVTALLVDNLHVSNSGRTSWSTGDYGDPSELWVACTDSSGFNPVAGHQVAVDIDGWESDEALAEAERRARADLRRLRDMCVQQTLLLPAPADMAVRQIADRVCYLGYYGADELRHLGVGPKTREIIDLLEEAARAYRSDHEPYAGMRAAYEEEDRARHEAGREYRDDFERARKRFGPQKPGWGRIQRHWQSCTDEHQMPVSLVKQIAALLAGVDADPADTLDG